MSAYITKLIHSLTQSNTESAILTTMNRKKKNFIAASSTGTVNIENDTHGIEKLLLKTQVSEKFLHSEVKLLIQDNNIASCAIWL